MKHQPAILTSCLARLLVAGAVIGSLTACSRDMSDLENYISEVKQREAGPIEPLPKLEPYKGFEYAAADLDDPFETLVETADETQPSSGIRPDFDRRKEPLEQFPLDSLRMRGILQQGERKFALIVTPEGIIHRAKVGDHMGKNYGRILQITETRIKLREIVPDGLGGWMEREASVALSE